MTDSDLLARSWPHGHAYCVAVIYTDDAIEVEVYAADSVSAMDKAHAYALAELRPGFVEIVLICEPEPTQHPIQTRNTQ